MILPPDDAALFYRAWGALLTWVNDQRHIVPHLPRPTPKSPIDATLALPIRNVIWAEDGLREGFLAEAAADLASAERDLIASWRHRVSGRFLIYQHQKEHSIFMDDDVYGVLGIYTPLAALIPHVPQFVEAVLLPFRDVIITDGLIGAMPVQIGFGPGAMGSLDRQYRAARSTGQIRTTLPARRDATPAVPAAPLKAPRKPSRRRTRGSPGGGDGRATPIAAPRVVDVEGPNRPPGHLTGPLDPEIAPLVDALCADPRIVTTGSCWGHGKKPAHIDLAVEGMDGLRAFVARLNQVDAQIATEGLLDVALNWSREVVTACAFDRFPNWIMLSLRIEGAGRAGGPSATLLKKIARLYRAADG